MADQLTIARPYGRAAFEFASTSSIVDAWSNWLALSAALVGRALVALLLHDVGQHGYNVLQLFNFLGLVVFLLKHT